MKEGQCACVVDWGAGLKFICIFGGQQKSKYIHLSYDVTVFQWITSCNKSVMATRVLKLLREYVMSLTTSVTTM